LLLQKFIRNFLPLASNVVADTRNMMARMNMVGITAAPEVYRNSDDILSFVMGIKLRLVRSVNVTSGWTSLSYIWAQLNWANGTKL
jgi:hypothetical protein